MKGVAKDGYFGEDEERGKGTLRSAAERKQISKTQAEMGREEKIKVIWDGRLPSWVLLK